MLYDFTEIASLMISLVFAVLAYLVAPWLKAMLTNEQLAYVRSAVNVAVYAAEKLYGAGNGAKKLAFAEEALRKEFNVKLDTKKLLCLIDSEIKKMEDAQSGGVTIVENIGESYAEEEEEEEPEEMPEV